MTKILNSNPRSKQRTQTDFANQTNKPNKPNKQTKQTKQTDKPPFPRSSPPGTSSRHHARDELEAPPSPACSRPLPVAASRQLLSWSCDGLAARPLSGLHVIVAPVRARLVHDVVVQERDQIRWERGRLIARRTVTSEPFVPLQGCSLQQMCLCFFPSAVRASIKLSMFVQINVGFW